MESTAKMMSVDSTARSTISSGVADQRPLCVSRNRPFSYRSVIRRHWRASRITGFRPGEYPSRFLTIMEMPVPSRNMPKTYIIQ